MFRTVAASLIALLLASTAGVAVAQTAKAGAEARTERVQMMNEEIEKRFAALDRNGDGAVHKAEAQAGLDTLFGRMDANHDGAVTKQELSEKLPRWFDKADANHDGKVSKAELDRFLDRREKRAEMKADTSRNAN